MRWINFCLVILATLALGFLAGCSSSGGPKAGDRLLVVEQLIDQDSTFTDGRSDKDVRVIYEVAKIDEVSGSKIKYSSLAGAKGEMTYDKIENGRVRSANGPEAYLIPDTKEDPNCGDIVIATNAFLEGAWIAVQVNEVKDHVVSARFFNVSGGHYTAAQIQAAFGGPEGKNFTQYVIAPPAVRGMICKTRPKAVTSEKGRALSWPDINCRPCS